MTDTVALDLGLRHERRGKAARPLAVRVASVMARMGSGVAAVGRRRSVPIMAYIGANGSGKTLCAVRDSLPSLDAGRLVYSTVPLYDAATGDLHDCYRPFTAWHQLLEVEHADFIMDEISGVASSRDHNALHPEVINRLNQLRKADITIRWTAPAWARADKVLREVSQAVTDCRGYLQDRAATKGAESDVLWAPRRLFRFGTYDMREFDEWSAGKRERVRPDVKEWFAGTGSRVFSSYRTLDAVERLEPYDPRICPECGLRMREVSCKGH